MSITKDQINDWFVEAGRKMADDLRKEVAKIMLMEDAEIKAYLAERERQDQIDRSRRHISDLESKLAWEKQSLKYLESMRYHSK